MRAPSSLDVRVASSLVGLGKFARCEGMRAPSDCAQLCGTSSREIRRRVSKVGRRLVDESASLLALLSIPVRIRQHFCACINGVSVSVFHATHTHAPRHRTRTGGVHVRKQYARCVPAWSDWHTQTIRAALYQWRMEQRPFVKRVDHTSIDDVIV